MPKRKSYSRKRSGKSSKVATAYRKLRKKQVYRKKRTALRSASSRKISAMPALRQARSVVVKFDYSSCATYGIRNSHQNAPAATGGDVLAIFPSDGINIGMNDIFNPAMLPGNFWTGHPETHAAGFTNFSDQYQRYKVIGSKTTVKIRRMGSVVPFTGTIDQSILPNPVAGSGIVPSKSQSVARMFDPSTADPLLLICTDRSNWQDVHSTVTENTIDDYMDVQKFAALGGVRWRELKPGCGTSATYTRKWSCKGKKNITGGMISDSIDGGTGTFDSSPGAAVGGNGTSPQYVDKINFKLRPFDKDSPFKEYYSDQRVMVTVDVEYIVKCTCPRYKMALNY